MAEELKHGKLWKKKDMLKFQQDEDIVAFNSITSRRVKWIDCY